MRISVVMTTYNGARYLREQIDSILSQTLQPQEIIICDDCSTDGTVAILEEYRYVQGLQFVVNDKQLGLIRNFKKVVSMASQDHYIALSDQDDIWLPDKLLRSAELMGTLDQSLPCMVHSDLIWVDELQKVLNVSFQNARGQSRYQHNLQTLFFANYVTGCTILMNPLLRLFFEEMPDDIKFHDAWIVLVASVFGLVGEIAEPTMKYRRHGNNLSIAANTKATNRYYQLFKDVVKSCSGSNEFLALQFQTARRFYVQYKASMIPEILGYFEKFLALEHQSYFQKKLAFRRTIRKFRN